MFNFILNFLFPDREALELDRQFVKEFPDSKPFFRNRLKRSGFGIVTMDNLTPYHRYELWRFIKENAPSQEFLNKLKKKCQQKTKGKTK